MIKNLNAAGAKIAFFQNRELPGQVRLVEQTICLDTLAEVVWQRDGMLGPTFVKS